MSCYCHINTIQAKHIIIQTSSKMTQTSYEHFQTPYNHCTHILQISIQHTILKQASSKHYANIIQIVYKLYTNITSTTHKQCTTTIQTRSKF